LSFECPEYGSSRREAKDRFWPIATTRGPIENAAKRYADHAAKFEAMRKTRA
jgi:hypothetical protein